MDEPFVKNIIFDFGGVIVNLDKEAVTDAFRALGFDVRNNISYYAQQGPFARLERGEQTETEFYRSLVEEIECCPVGCVPSGSVTPERIRDAWNRMLADIPSRRLRALLRLRRRYRVFLLSNTNIIHWDYACRNQFNWEGHRPEDFFERIFLSYKMHLAKPDPAIFRRALDDAGLTAGETIFIDDSEANCAAARSVGLQTYCPAQPDDWMPLFM